MSRAAAVFGVVLTGAVVLAACTFGPDPELVDVDTSSSSTSAAPITGEQSSTQPATVTTPQPPVTAPPFEPLPIDWEPLNDAVDIGTLGVPVDYAVPDADQFQLYVARYNALDQEHKIGTLLVNPGGPGFGGSDFAVFAAQQFDRQLRERFDIVGWDPRGTGQSEPVIDCISDYDPYFTEIDNTPADDAARAHVVEVASDFAEACKAANGEILQHVGTNDSPRDIDTLRRALGEDTISFFGFSYGSELGGVWATMFPETVRAMVIDGAADPGADQFHGSLDQLRGFESALDAFLAACSADSDCEFHNDGDAEGAFDALLEQLDAHPIAGAGGRPLVNRDVAINGVAMAMYSDAFWPSLEASLEAAQRGDGSGLLALHDQYFRRNDDGTWGNQLEAFQVISCADVAERPSVAEVDAQSPEFHATAPRFVPDGAIGGYTCTFFAPSRDPRGPITGVGAGPVVVIGTTGDPTTPLDTTRAMDAALEDGRLVVVDAARHTGYGANACVIDVVNEYLIDLEPPADNVACG